MNTETLVAVYLVTPVITGLYALYLHRHPGYAPDWTWVTVVVGNTFIGLAYLVSQLAVPIAGLDAFLRLLWLNMLAGGPIIAWQVWEMGVRQREQAVFRAARNHNEQNEQYEYEAV